MTPSRSRIPTATYRMQFNRQFTFKQGREIVPYLHDLGISHVYSSPLYKATPGSMHGYDINDHNELNPEIGTREEFDAFVNELHAHGMGLIVDFVPNHMGIASQLNGWWIDVLENGASSVYAHHFDIEWNPLKEDLKNRVLLPILGDQYGRVLERGEFKLSFEHGAFFVHYFSLKLPLAPRSYVFILKPALARLQEMKLPQDFLSEFQSVITALEHLPPRTVTDPARIEERVREKEVIKRRLVRRCEDCPQAASAIEAAMREIEGVPGDARSFDAFDELLNAQVFRLSFWRVAAEEINYRRFFDINDLAAIRVELPEVFEAAHRLTFELIGNGSIDGLRIDHVDGLWHPRVYLEELQARTAGLIGASAGDLPLYLVVEKILLGDERLPSRWPVHGTTGYEFANDAIRLLIDPAAEAAITDSYAEAIGHSLRFQDVAYHGKQLVMRLSLASEVNALSHMLDRLSETNRWFRDFTLNALTFAVREFISCFPVYRTYVSPDEEPTAEDRAAVRSAVRQALRRNPGSERSIFDFLGDILLKKFPENIDDAGREQHMRFVMKFQQCSSPVMAKGVEDTAFYIYNRFCALNEVGGEPQHFAVSPDRFHTRYAAQLRDHPHSLLATSTHDTKRSEDVRTRIAALSEIPGAWRKSLRRWQAANERFRREVEGEQAPDANEMHLLYQAMLGTWPFDAMTEEQLEAYIKRLQEYSIKACREAKVNSSWVQPNEAWETAMCEFVAGILREKRGPFMKSFRALAGQVAQLGAINSLAQLVLKSTVPGVPDTYQGCELWSFTLVDPDNRVPVDFDAAKQAMQSAADASPGDLIQRWQDGRIKQFITRTLLRFRREHPELFQSGEFTRLQARGTHAESCYAFLRRTKDEAILVVIPRLTQRVGFPPVGKVWGDTAVELPPDWHGKSARNIFTGGESHAAHEALLLSDLLRDLPVAVCHRGTPV
jgi:(1->4)-alpha-D-glucan 1-alpha-D-glucosylmutase